MSYLVKVQAKSEPGDHEISDKNAPYIGHRYLIINTQKCIDLKLKTNEF